MSFNFFYTHTLTYKLKNLNSYLILYGIILIIMLGLVGIDKIKLIIVVIVFALAFWFLFIFFGNINTLLHFADYPQSIQWQNTHFHSNHEQPNHTFEWEFFFKKKKRIKIIKRIANFSRAKWSSGVSFEREEPNKIQAKSGNKRDRVNYFSDFRAFRCTVARVCVAKRMPNGMHQAKLQRQNEREREEEIEGWRTRIVCIKQLVWQFSF